MRGGRGQHVFVRLARAPQSWRPKQTLDFIFNVHVQLAQVLRLAANVQLSGNFTCFGLYIMEPGGWRSVQYMAGTEAMLKIILIKIIWPGVSCTSLLAGSLNLH